jgi:threonine 3-dehydrogenase
MKAVVKMEPKFGADFIDLEIPEIGEGDLLVKVNAAALCKSDVEVYEWGPLVAEANYNLPLTLGHEYAGCVVEVGKSVKTFAVGDLVAGETHVPCGYCHTCRTGNQHICPNHMGVLGRTLNGCFAEYLRMPASSAIKLPDRMEPCHGALLEPFGTALHALSKVEPSGKSVAILGTGTIGLMAVELAKNLGATQIFAVDINEKRLEESLKRGADFAINGMKENVVEAIMQETKGIGVAGVVELTGNPRVINQALEALRIGGKMVQVGMVENPLTIEKYMKWVAYKELILTGLYGRRMFNTWETMLEILDTGRINLGAYVGVKLALSEYEKGLKMMYQCRLRYKRYHFRSIKH